MVDHYHSKTGPQNLKLDFSSPYLSADLRLMASSFNTTVASLEDELMSLILDGKIQARIDSHNKVRQITFITWWGLKYPTYLHFEWSKAVPLLNCLDLEWSGTCL